MPAARGGHGDDTTVGIACDGCRIAIRLPRRTIAVASSGAHRTLYRFTSVEGTSGTEGPWDYVADTGDDRHDARYSGQPGPSPVIATSIATVVSGGGGPRAAIATGNNGHRKSLYAMDRNSHEYATFCRIPRATTLW
jgi:hypothetical protein